MAGGVFAGKIEFEGSRRETEKPPFPANQTTTSIAVRVAVAQSFEPGSA
jgi:hypothetical protein